jgi:carbon-monoxide dehydrogenase iron sulfur subunit
MSESQVTARVSVDAELCRGCDVCTLACSLYHEGECSPSLARLSVRKDMALYEFEILFCQHCDPPECMLVCPVDAIQLDDRGVAVMDEDLCIQCGSCQDACPFDAIFYHEAQDRYLKCNLCSGRDEGPLCVQVCPVRALAHAELEVAGAEGT